MTIPTVDAIRALDGRIFAMLSDDEQAILDFYRIQGRKFDVCVSIINKADPAELARATSKQHADQILKSANSLVAVTVGTGAATAWAARAGQLAH
jgi:hypothetical protein